MPVKKSILLLRHAKSGWAREGGEDHERVLTETGIREASFMGTRLRQLDLVPDFALVSTAVRAQQTADAVVRASGFNGTRIDTKRLYLAEPSVFFDLFTEVPPEAERLLVIAHNPGIADLAEMMTHVQVGMCTAGLAQITCDVGEISEVTRQTPAHLVDFHRPLL